jgi:hypothetical protein
VFPQAEVAIFVDEVSAAARPVLGQGGILSSTILTKQIPHGFAPLSDAERSFAKTGSG